MKCGLITFHDTQSMGGNLQCFALYQILKQYADDVEIIRFNRNPELAEKKANRKKNLKTSLISTVSSVTHNLERKSQALQKAKIHSFFLNNYSYTTDEYSNINELKSISSCYDCYFVGSDQVWNPLVYGLEEYFLTFVDPSKKTIAYAPSIGIKDIPERLKEQYSEWLSHVQYLSCREKEGANAICSLTGRSVEHVLDPTLVLTHNEWKKLIAFPPSPEKKKYLLCYFLGSMHYEREFAKKIAAELGLEIVYLYNNPADIVSFKKVVKGYGIEEFLSWFENASFVCTDSFHGTAFAVNFNKPFFTFARRGYSSASSVFSRIGSLMKQLGCEDRIVTPDMQFSSQSINMVFSEINELLDAERKKSKQYLTRCIND